MKPTTNLFRFRKLLYTMCSNPLISPTRQLREEETTTLSDVGLTFEDGSDHSSDSGMEDILDTKETAA